MEVINLIPWMILGAILGTAIGYFICWLFTVSCIGLMRMFWFIYDEIKLRKRNTHRKKCGLPPLKNI